MALIDIKVPNIGDFKDVEIIEILVSNGQDINKGDSIITLEHPIISEFFCQISSI